MRGVFQLRYHSLSQGLGFMEMRKVYEAWGLFPLGVPRIWLIVGFGLHGYTPVSGITHI